MSFLSRRQLLSGLGLGSVGAIVSNGRAGALAAPRVDGNAVSGPVVPSTSRIETFGPEDARTTEVFSDGLGMHGYRQGAIGTRPLLNSDPLVIRLGGVDGEIIERVDVWMASATGAFAAPQVTLYRWSIDGTVLPSGVWNLATAPMPTGSGIQQLTFTPNHTIDRGSYYYAIDMLFGAGAPTGSQEFAGAKVTYGVPVSNGFFPVSPSRRVADTRSGTRLGANQQSIVDVSAYVPAGARFAIATLTATGTVGGGFLSAFPADVAWPGNSSLNWTASNQDLANTIVVGLSSAGAFAVRCGGGSTHVLVDITGFVL
jgi:hypothetical protein